MAIARVVRGWHLVAAVAVSAGLFAGPRRVGAQQPQQQADSMRHEATAAIIGHVTDASGAGLPGAEITLGNSDHVHTITGDSGQFRIMGLVAGTMVFNVRRIGFEAATFTAVLHPGKVGRATFHLTASAQPLPTVAVSDTSNTTHWLDQFQRRRQGTRGTFFTRADIVRQGATTGTDIVRTVAGIRLVPGRGGIGHQVVMTRGDGVRACIPQMFVHNMPYSGTLDDFIAEDIEALEVYIGISEIPPELTKNGRGADCGAIVVWTRDPSKKP